MMALFHVAASGSFDFILLAHCHNLLGLLNRRKPLLMLIVTPVHFLLGQDKKGLLAENKIILQIVNIKNSERTFYLGVSSPIQHSRFLLESTLSQRSVYVMVNFWGTQVLFTSTNLYFHSF